MHEDLRRSDNVKLPSDRSFGIVAGCFFTLVAVLPAVFRHHPIRTWALYVAAASFILALIWPRALYPLNFISFRISRLLYRVVSPVALGVLFFGIVTPFGLLMRAFGRDPLSQRRDPSADSYWIPRQPPGPAPESMKQQF
jgi:hypothetical protein